MKKILTVFLLVLILFGIDLSLKAQSEITFSIKKEIIKEENWVMISITNNNKEDVFLYSEAWWDPIGDTHAYLRSPLSFVRFIGNPNDSITRYETKDIILSTSTLKKGSGKLRPLNIKAGETYTEVYRLFGERYYPIRTFVESYKCKLKELQAELTLKGINTSGNTYDEIILSNTRSAFRQYVFLSC